MDDEPALTSTPTIAKMVQYRGEGVRRPVALRLTDRLATLARRDQLEFSLYERGSTRTYAGFGCRVPADQDTYRGCPFALGSRAIGALMAPDRRTPSGPSGTPRVPELVPTAAAAPPDVVSLTDGLEGALLKIVAELLVVDSLDKDDNLLLLGADSLLCAQMIAQIGRRFGVAMSLRSIFVLPTVAAMAVEVERLLVKELDAMTEVDAEWLTGLAPGSL